MGMSWEKERKASLSRLRAIKSQIREIEKEYAETRKATINDYLRLGRGIEGTELEEELEDLSRQQRSEILSLYNKPMKGCEDDDF